MTYNGDQARKTVLIEHGFRLPSAADNRPLKGEEFWDKARQTVFVSATPGNWAIEVNGGEVAEQVIRPTGVLDPVLEVCPTTGQVDDLLGEIRSRAAKQQRVLVITLTKLMAEDLVGCLAENKVRVRYVHFEIHSVERIEIIQDLRLGQYDVLVGVNLLREGVNLPEVSLAAILDAHKKGFLCAKRLREIQQPYNEKHGIVPTAAGKKASNSVLSFLELSRKLKEDGSDADLVQMAGKAVRALENQADADLALEALVELIDQLGPR